MKHYIFIVFGVSEVFYRAYGNKIASIGQCYIASSNICRDPLYFSIKQVENKKLGIIIKDPITNHKEQQVSTVFIDDTDFTLEGSNAQVKI